MNDVWQAQVRNADINADDGTGANVQGGFEGIFQITGTSPIGPDTGEAWIIHQIDYGWVYRWEDDSADNLSESLSGVWVLSDEGEVVKELRSGGALDGFRAGNTRVIDDLDALSGRSNEPWIVDVQEIVANMHNDANGQAGGSGNFALQPGRTWRPPFPQVITDRTQLDVGVTWMGPFATSQGDVQAVLTTAVNVWYESAEIEGQFRR